MATGESDEKRALTLLWKIENIRFWERDAWTLVSPNFSTRTLGENNKLKVTLDEVDRQLNFELGPLEDALDFQINCEFSFIGSNGFPFISETVWNHDFQLSEKIKLYDFASSQEVFETRQSTFLPHDTLTVRCRIWKSEGELQNAEFVSVRSRFEIMYVSFSWPIKGFSNLKLNEEVATPVILKSPNELLNKFQLKFSLKGVSLKDAMANLELASVLIRGSWEVTLKVSVLDIEQKVLKCLEEKSKYVADTYDLLYEEDAIKPINISQFLSRTDLLSVKFNCLTNDVLNLHLEFSFLSSHPTLYTEGEYFGPSNLSEDFWKGTSSFLDKSSCYSAPSLDSPETSLQVEDSLAILREDLLNLYRDQSMSDFELHSGDVSFPVHKIILSARSPFFKAMFSSNMQESDSKSLNVPDLNAHTLNRMLTFLYGSTVDALEWGNALNLYYAADKYQVYSLKRECCSFFRSKISVKNVSDIVTLADRHQDLDLKSLARCFIQKHFDETLSSPEWATFLESDGQLAGVTMHQVYLENLKARKN